MKKLIVENKVHGSREVLLDDDVYEWASKYKWYLRKDYSRKREAFYVVRSVKQPDGKHTLILLHREIMNTPKGLVTDHLNGNGLDNRRANLRVCTNRENQINRRGRIDRAFKYIGVQKDKRALKKPWRPDVVVSDSSKKRGQRRVSKGYYVTEEEAAYQRDLYMVMYHGTGVVLNFPEKLNEYLNLIKQDMVNV
tara:strand:+ start:616 stop:1197 length:582 start_codon:yes stop_codon:yes gene_type:complete